MHGIQYDHSFVISCHWITYPDEGEMNIEHERQGKVFIFQPVATFCYFDWG